MAELKAVVSRDDVPILLFGGNGEGALAIRLGLLSGFRAQSGGSQRALEGADFAKGTS